MTEREKKEDTLPDLLVIAPSTLDRFIVVTTGNNPEDSPTVKRVKSQDVFTDDMLLNLSLSLQGIRRSSMHGFLTSMQRLACLAALGQIADHQYGKNNWQGKRRVQMVLASSFESFTTAEEHIDTRKIIADAGLDEELFAVVDELKTEALIRGTEYEELVWENPNTVPKQ